MRRRNKSGGKLIQQLIILAIFAILASTLMGKLRSGSIVPPSPEPVKPEETVQRNKDAWPPIESGIAFIKSDDMLRRNYYVVLDGSGSMQDRGCSGGMRKFDSAVEALNTFFYGIPEDANVGLLVFDYHGFSERVPLGRNNREQLRRALQEARPSGGTPLSRAVEAGYQALTRQAGQQLGYGEYHLVIVTDGEANPGFDPTEEVNWIIDKTAIVIHTIGYCIGSGHSLNQPGRTLYRTADSSASLSRELQAVLAEAETFDVSQFK
jgi:Ca-activated chloride channel family protein